MILYLKDPNTLPGTLRSDKHFWQNSRIQNQHPYHFQIVNQLQEIPAYPHLFTIAELWD
jgi:hypothetical protein